MRCRDCLTRAICIDRFKKTHIHKLIVDCEFLREYIGIIEYSSTSFSFKNAVRMINIKKDLNIKNTFYVASSICTRCTITV